MLLGKRSRKMVAATLLTVMLTNTFGPTISYALTSGPTQPEATSFEPVDTTDIVNLQTGDLAYNIPLIEVPGPDGSYPLSLSYHGGILPNMDASWVGLGWTLNPGAINRSVSGMPDDWVNLTSNSRSYWSGQTTSTYTVGGDIGIANSPFNVSFGLQVVNDSYKGIGVGFDFTIGANGSPISFGIAKSPMGGSVHGVLNGNLASMGIQADGFEASAGLGFSTNFSSMRVGTTGSVGFDNVSMTGNTLATGSNKPSFSVGGMSASAWNSTSTKGSLSTSKSGFDLSIPVLPFFKINLGFSKVRNWSDETISAISVGSLWSPLSGNPANNQYDNYSLLEDPAAKDMVAFPDPTVLQGGAFPDFDVYSVTGQGLSGNIRPYQYQGQIMNVNRQTLNGTTYENYYQGSVAGAPVQFRFINDFAGTFQQAYTPYNAATMTQDLTNSSVAPDPFDPNPVYDSLGTSLKNVTMPSYPNYAVAGSRHVDMGVKITPYNVQGYNLATSRIKANMINGFSITNESGVTYHYGLPAYSYNEEIYQEKIDRSNGLYFNRGTRPNAYAYTWYLTSITGSDYVDRNGDGHADAGDWGYWVNLEYGKWSNEYSWRNPSEGFQRDEDNQFQNVSMGFREVYYLNAIRTRSHVLLFEKEVRNDGMGESMTANTHNTSQPDYKYPNGLFDATSSRSLQLSKIYLLNVADAAMINPASGTGNLTGAAVPCSDCAVDANVLDKSDVDAVGRAALEAKSIRVIDFNYDYSLCANTTNSITSITNGVNNLTGKLTLNALTFRGKGGVSSMPSMQFGYEIPTEDLKTASGTMTNTTFVTNNPLFQVGDLLMTNDNTGMYCGVVTSFNTSNGTTTYQLQNSNYTSTNSIAASLKTTKNPPYNKDAYDMWGMYKSNYDLVMLQNNENMGRNTDAVSAAGVDAWGLRKITTQLGDVIKLKYSSDTYHQVGMGNTYSLVMNNIQVVPNSNNGAITFQLADYGSSTNPNSIVQVGSVFPRCILLCNGQISGCSGCYLKSTQVVGPITVTAMSSNAQGATITAILSSPINVNAFNGSIFTGNLWVDQSTDFYGGGVRVSNITVNHTFNNSASQVNYNYNSPANVSSGVTTYLPAGLDAYDAVAVNSNSNNWNYGTMSNWAYYYRKALYQNTNSIYPLARELPAPGVMYQYVTVTNQYSNPDDVSAWAVAGSTQYQF